MTKPTKTPMYQCKSIYNRETVEDCTCGRCADVLNVNKLCVCSEHGEPFEDCLVHGNPPAVKELLIDILAIIRGVAYDQATRYFSGDDWFKEIDKRLTELKEKIEEL